MEVWRDFERSFVGLVVRSAGKIVARASTVDGARKPLSWVLDEFFLGITDELEELGVSRRIAAGMFGVSRRTYLRQVHAAQAGVDAMGESLWWSVLRVLRSEPMSREDVMARFSRHPPELLGAILFDMLGTHMLEDRDGLLVATDEVDAWSDERLLNFINLLDAEGGVPAASELAATLGVDVERVEHVLDLPRDLLPVVNAEHEALWGMLGMLVEHTYMAVMRELSGESVDSYVYRIRITESGQRHIPRLQEIVANGRERIWAELNELLAGHGTHDETSTTQFTTVVSQMIRTSDSLSGGPRPSE